jgi:short-subunit dehydrogenase
MSKNILIVGASSGLGKSLAELYASDGYKVGIIGRREELLLELQSHFSENIYIKKGDISAENIGQILQDLIEMMNGVDIIIIAASIINFNVEHNNTLETETININVNGFCNVVNFAWHYFKDKGTGQIVGITSIASVRGNKEVPAYHASKAFQSIYLESLRVKTKFERNNITITELIPGYIETAMGKNSRAFWITPVDIAAKKSINAIRNKRNRVFIPKRWWLVYHLQQILPIFIYDWIINGSWKFKQKQ